MDMGIVEARKVDKSTEIQSHIKGSNLIRQKNVKANQILIKVNSIILN